MTFTLEGILYASRKDSVGIRLKTFDGNISAFCDRGGKILHWHGLTDQLLVSRERQTHTTDEAHFTLNAL
ncbi:hypothetical protein PMIN03_010997 [Paraphaeosphaeria minitans]